MSTEPSTLADLRKRGIIGSLEIVAAIDVYMLDPAAGPYRFASGHSVDIPALVGPTTDSERLINRSGAHMKAFRTKVAEIVMAARPTPP